MTDQFVPTDSGIDPEEEEVLDIETEEEDFLDDIIGDDDEFELPDPNSVITVRTPGAQTKYVPTAGEEALPVSRVMNDAGLFSNGAVEFWLDGVQVHSEDLVPAGRTLTVVGSVKGG